MCLRQMAQKFDTTKGEVLFEACPWCGFVYADPMPVGVEKDKLWDFILSRYGVPTREELIRSYMITKFTETSNREFFPSIFDHTNRNGVSLMYTLLWKEVVNVGFRLSGLPVKETKTDATSESREGILLAYEEGKIRIQWNDTKRTESPNEEREASRLGENIHLINSKDEGDKM